MDLEVVGRHALFFDDDSSASFVNSPAALVDWNSLSIDRYDVRHLLSSLPPRPKRRSNTSPPRHQGSPSEAELDYERYLDLPSTSPEHEQDLENESEPVNVGGYNAVPFSYGNAGDMSEQKNADAESSFRPPFSVPENLLQNLPPTEKVHQIIVRTAMFVSKHGGQSEIVLRVKQGDNPTFGFLMPDHHLHPYFKFLVDHPELVNKENKANGVDQSSNVEGGGALSLLGSIYGSVEDDDNMTQNASEHKEDEKEKPVSSVNITVSNGSEQTDSSVCVAKQDEKDSKSLLPSSKEKAPLIKRNQPISTVKARASSGTKKDRDTLGSVCPAADKSQASALPSFHKVEMPVVEPPAEMKRVVDKIVEFVLRNGKEFEAVLAEQDRKYGRFPFLLPSSLYYPYYQKVLHKAEESKLLGKSFNSEKHDSTGVEKRNGVSKESDTMSLGSDIPYDSDKKEKFKMVLGRSKKDGLDPPTKPPTPPNVTVGVDATAAAAILQAATRGIRNPNLDILTKISSNGTTQGPSSVSAIAKSAAVVVASEADSSEANLTKEQKLKAERLKRAKAFAAMIKRKEAPLKSEPLLRSSAEPPDSGLSGSTMMGREREGSSVPVGDDSSDKTEKSEKKDISDDIERRSKRRYRSRANVNEAEEEEVEKEDEEEEEEEKEEKKHNHSQKKHRSSHKHRKRHSSKDKDHHHRHRHKHDDNSSSDLESRHSRHRHKKDEPSEDGHDDGSRHSRYRLDHSSEDEHGHSRYRPKKDRSGDDDDHDRERRKRHRHKHNCLSDDEHDHSRYRAKKDGSDDDDHNHYLHKRHQHKHDNSRDDEHDHSRYRPKKDSSFDVDHDHDRRKRHRHKHDSLSEHEHRRCRHRHKHDSSTDDESKHPRRSRKHRKRSHSVREADLEEGEIKSDASKVSESTYAVVSREASVDLAKSCNEETVRASSSQPSNTTTATTSEVPDELRAKIRAMLMATL